MWVCRVLIKITYLLIYLWRWCSAGPALSRRRPVVLLHPWVFKQELVAFDEWIVRRWVWIARLGVRSPPNHEVRPGVPEQRQGRVRLRDAVYYSHRHRWQLNLSQGVLLVAHAQDVSQHLSSYPGDIGHIRSAVVCPRWMASSRARSLAWRALRQPPSAPSRYISPRWHHMLLVNLVII